MEKLDRLGWAAGISFRAYGVRVGIRTTTPDVLPLIYPLLPPGWNRSRDRLWITFIRSSSEGRGRRQSVTSTLFIRALFDWHEQPISIRHFACWSLTCTFTSPSEHVTGSSFTLASWDGKAAPSLFRAEPGAEKPRSSGPWLQQEPVITRTSLPSLTLQGASIPIPSRWGSGMSIRGCRTSAPSLNSGESSEPVRYQ